MSNASLGHDGDGHSLHNLLDHAGVRHAGNATLDADIGGDTLEGHDGGGTGLLSNAGLQIGSRQLATMTLMRMNDSKAYLLRIDNIHNNATLQHLGQTGLDGEVIAGGTVLSGHCEM